MILRPSLYTLFPYTTLFRSWRDRQGDRVADRFVEPVVRARLVEERLILVRAEVVVVAQLVVNRAEFIGVGLDAHHDPQVGQVDDVPGARVANLDPDHGPSVVTQNA